MSVLDRIVETKRDEVAALLPRRRELEEAAASAPGVPDFEAALRCGSDVAIIAEVKRRSPSAGELAAGAAAAGVATLYERGGAAAVSVLTDGPWFGGALADLEAVRGAVAVPLLRKDFTVDAVQLWEARASGASAVLLIARILDDAELRDHGALAVELGMTALVEVHDEAELERAVASGARVIGVNNRDLGTFETDLATTERLAPAVPAECVLVGESGIVGVADVMRLATAGVDAVLVGSALMRSADPVAAVRRFAAVPRRRRT